ncbi:MAG TPA: hypothetical protein VLK82_10060 [Candidatus Tectomicrobia bacterium]|nr:hypothetical protein [Candidatus Tectomicrobia bacterium]
MGEHGCGVGIVFGLMAQYVRDTPQLGGDELWDRESADIAGFSDDTGYDQAVHKCCVRC